MIQKNIVLIGAPGCGKSTIGRLLAEKLNLPFYDVDEYIEEKEGKKISEIFKNGEDSFRRVETEAVGNISKSGPGVISTGGGVVTRPVNMEILRSNSVIFFINRPVENIASDVDVSIRPLLAGDANRLYKLYEERYPLYKKYSDHEIVNDGDLKDVLNKIHQIAIGNEDK